jgi:hypothetical protein
MKPPRARWKTERVGVQIYIDGEPSTLVIKNGTWWRAHGDVIFTDPSRQRVLDVVLREFADAGIVVENAPPPDD